GHLIASPLRSHASEAVFGASRDFLRQVAGLGAGESLSGACAVNGVSSVSDIITVHPVPARRVNP
ncbi:MAG TPA: hypothetical protein VIM06_02425, partial [Rhodanobacter sp.]